MLLTLTETLGEMVRAGYAPRRSIKIAHWDAEEYLMIGSTEWVEQLREELWRQSSSLHQRGHVGLPVRDLERPPRHRSNRL